MSGRWIIVFGILIWLFYDCIKPYVNLKDWSFQNQFKLKCIVAVIVCFIIWRLPSLDVFLKNNEEVTEYLRVVFQSRDYSEIDANPRVQSGISLADEETPASVYTVSSTAPVPHVSHPPFPTEKTKYTMKW